MTNMILRRQLAARKNKKKGFTLIELIVVIVIIAIIAAIAVPALTRYIESANKRAAQATAHNIQVVLQAEATDAFDATINPALNGALAANQSLALFTEKGSQGPMYDIDTAIEDILAANGVYIDAGTLTNIGFIGKKLDGFKYTHNNTAAYEITFKDGTFEFTFIAP